jgi:CheY-like chemotaxis protein
MPLAARAPHRIAVHAGAAQTMLPLRVTPAAVTCELPAPLTVPVRVTEILTAWNGSRSVAGKPAFVAPRAEPAPELVRGAAPLEHLRELEKLVERDVQLRRDFTSPTDAIRPARAHPTVLVIDDSPDTLKLLSIYLSRTGFQVVTACSAEDGLAKLRHHAIDALVLDAKMPGANGGHVCRVLQEDPAYAARRHVPVIVYTGCPEEFPSEVRARWRADEYVVKGGDMLPLITALVRHTNSDARS